MESNACGCSEIKGVLVLVPFPRQHSKQAALPAHMQDGRLRGVGETPGGVLLSPTRPQTAPSKDFRLNSVVWKMEEVRGYLCVAGRPTAE